MVPPADVRDAGQVNTVLLWHRGPLRGALRIAGSGWPPGPVLILRRVFKGSLFYNRETFCGQACLAAQPWHSCMGSTSELLLLLKNLLESSWPCPPGWEAGGQRGDSRCSCPIPPPAFPPEP